MNWYKKPISEEDIGFKRESNDLVINIENPAGTERYGLDSDGHEWRIKMEYDYGFISKAKGSDEEGLDVYVGPNMEAKEVYVVHQNDPNTGEYD